MRRDQAEKARTRAGDDARTILDTALFAIARGAGGVGLDQPATEAVHEQFMRKVRPALEKADWQEDWRRERVYLQAYAQGMGHRAATLAAEDRRSVITRQDIEAAAIKMCGYMPIAGRWCP